MHFPTLPRRWRLSSSSSSEASKPPKYGRKQPQQSRKTASPQSKLFRSASFTGDPVFKVPQVPKRQQQQKVGLRETPAGCQPCPHCPSSGYEPSWRSRSLVNLQPAAAPQQNHEAVSTASIFSNNLRSNSWRNLSLIASESSTYS